MLKYVHQLSAFLFSVLGIAFFVAYILYRNSIGGSWPLMVLTKWDLPLLFSALLYGGLSVYRSIGQEQGSRVLAWVISVPLTLAFLASVVLNFWNQVS